MFIYIGTDKKVYGKLGAVWSQFRGLPCAFIGELNMYIRGLKLCAWW